EVEVAVDVVDRPGGLQSLNQLDDHRDGLDGADEVLRRYHPQPRHVVGEQLRLLVGEIAPVLPGLDGALEQRVVDVGDVLDVGDREPGIVPGAIEHVEGDVGGGVTQVGCVVRRDTAHVHRRCGAGGRDPGTARRGVVQPAR